MTNAITTTHNLNFEASESFLGRLFRVGTCEGQWGGTADSLYILSVINNEPNNGHLNDVFEWFEYSCKQHHLNLLVLECFNSDFYDHLITKRGFVKLDEGRKNVIKVFNKKSYRKLLKNGNAIIMAGSLNCI